MWMQKKSAVGRADVVIKMQEAIYVFEFKVDGTPEEALAQINSKQYAIPYRQIIGKSLKWELISTVVRELLENGSLKTRE